MRILTFLGCVFSLMQVASGAPTPAASSSPAVPAAANLLSGIRLQRAGDAQAAAKAYAESAQAGNKWAQYNYALCLYAGFGVEKNLEEAAKLWQQAASQGLPCASYNLACCYARGEGVPQDYAKAVELWQQAANAGIAEAQMNLAICHHRGLGVPQDEDKAEVCLKQALAMPRS